MPCVHVVAKAQREFADLLLRVLGRQERRVPRPLPRGGRLDYRFCSRFLGRAGWGGRKERGSGAQRAFESMGRDGLPAAETSMSGWNKEGGSSYSVAPLVGDSSAGAG